MDGVTYDWFDATQQLKCVGARSAFQLFCRPLAASVSRQPKARHLCEVMAGQSDGGGDPRELARLEAE